MNEEVLLIPGHVLDDLEAVCACGKASLYYPVSVLTALQDRGLHLTLAWLLPNEARYARAKEAIRLRWREKARQSA